MKKASPSTDSRLHVATYCRIVGGEEQNAVLDVQRAYYTERIGNRPDWTMVGIFADICDSRSERPEFQKMLHKCIQKKIDLILVPSVSRFARNMVDCLSIVRELRELGVAVVFEKEGFNTMSPNCDIRTSLMAEYARAECDHLTRNSTHMPLVNQTGRGRKRTWKKMIRLSGCPDKTITFRME